MKIVSGIAAFIFGLGIYAFWIEPYWIVVTHQEVTAKVRHPLRIALVADVHTRGHGRREKRLLQLLDAEKPDVIVVAGDSITIDSDYTPVRELYRKLHAPGGVFVVRGNWENAMTWEETGMGKRPPPHFTEENFYRDSGVTFLFNQPAKLADDIWLIGIDEFTRGTPNFEAASEGVPMTAYKIALFHSPGYFDQIAGRVDLALTGHTHGGQVRLPFFPPFYCPTGCGRFVEGWYESKGSKLYITRGIGTSIVDVRLFCRPELTILSVVPEK